MIKRLVPMTMLALMIFCSCSFGEIIYLKDGDVIRGTIQGRDDRSITVNVKDSLKKIDIKEIKRIKTYEEIKEENNSEREAMEDLDEKVNEDSLEMLVGPKIGFYNFRNSQVYKYHKDGLVFGINADLWVNRYSGVQFEFETYDNTFSGSALSFDPNSNSFAMVEYTERLTLTPFWLSYLYKFKKSKFYVGAGLGLIMTNLYTKSGTAGITNKGDFAGYQFLGGFTYKKVGLAFKYSVIDTNAFWNYVNYGGYTFSLNIYF